DFHVTGVQTCALPISAIHAGRSVYPFGVNKSWRWRPGFGYSSGNTRLKDDKPRVVCDERAIVAMPATVRGRMLTMILLIAGLARSEERRVGKEGRLGW